MDLFSSIVQFALFSAAVFAVLVLIASHLRFQRMTRAAKKGATEGGSVEPLAIHVAHLLGTAHRAPDPFHLFLLETAAPPAEGPERDRLLEELAGLLRTAVRAGDTVLRHGPGRIGLIVRAPRERAEMLAERILKIARRIPGARAAVGGATHPENGEKTQVLFEAAVAALEDARARGGACFALAPPAGVPAGAKEQKAPPPSATAGLLDELTGVLREERLGSFFQKYLARHRKLNEPVSLLLADVDHLDRYNEHYGRAAGDAILRGLAELIQQGVREMDLIGRYGGDGFLVIMNCSAGRAQEAAQRLIQLVRRSTFSAGSGPLRATLSIGVAGYPEHGAHPARLLECAEAAVKAAQAGGFSRCMIFDSHLLQSQRPPPARPTDAF